jgi:hypothetical protein
MSTHVHLYDAATGLFTGVSLHTNVTGPKALTAFIAENTPAGQSAYVGYVDPLAQKIDVATGQLIDYRPPKPTPAHEWNATTKRWQKPVGLKRPAALARIAELETGQHRTVRETLINVCHAVDALKEALAPASTPVREAVDRMYATAARLELIEAELGRLRADL